MKSIGARQWKVFQKMSEFRHIPILKWMLRHMDGLIQNRSNEMEKLYEFK